MKKLLIHCKRCAVLLLALTAAFAVSCTGDLEDDLADLTVRVEGIEGDVADLKAALDKGALVSDYTTGTDSEGRKTHVISLTDGQTITLTDGLDGEDGEDGKDGTDGTAGAPGADAGAAVTVDDSNAEFLLITLNAGKDDESVVVASKVVSYPESISLRGLDKIDLVLEKGVATTIKVQINPSDVSIKATDFYFLLCDKKVDFSDLVEDPAKGENYFAAALTKASALGVETVVMDAESFEDLGNGIYAVDVVWAAGATEYPEVLVSAAYNKASYDAATGEISTSEVEVLSETTLSIENLYCVPIEETHVSPWDLTSAAKDDAYAVSENTVDNPLKFTFMETTYKTKNDVKTVVNTPSINITEMLKDYYSANLAGVCFVKKTPSTTKYTDWQNFRKNNSTEVVASAEAGNIHWTGENVGETAYNAAGDLIFTFTTPDVTATTTYELVMLFDDNLVNEKYYDAKENWISQGYVERYVEVTVIPYAEDEIDDEFNVWSPNTSTGKIMGTDNSADGKVAILSLVNAADRTYTITAETISYDYNGGSKGQMLDASDAAIKAYQAYLDGVAASWIDSGINDRPITAEQDELDITWTFSNTAEQPLLPGIYTINVHVIGTEAGVTVYDQVYKQTVNIWVPDFHVDLNNTDDLDLYGALVLNPAADGKKNAKLTTYDWHDFDLARAVNVTSTSQLDASATKYTTPATGLKNISYEYLELMDNSTLYSANDITLFDFAYLRYTNRYDETIKDIMRTEEEFLKKGVTKAWYMGLTATFDNTVKNVIDVADLPAAVSKDVTKTVTFYVSLATGLEIPVTIKQDINGDTEVCTDGAIDVTIARNTLKDITETSVKVMNGEEKVTNTDGNPVSYVALYNAAKAGSPYVISVNDAVSREKKVYLNNAYYGSVKDKVNGTDVTKEPTFVNNVPMDGDYYTSDKVNFVERDYTFYADATYELDDDGKPTTEIKDGEVGFKAAWVKSQIGDGSANLYSTKNLVATVTYAVGELKEVANKGSFPEGIDKNTKLIAVDANGALSGTTTTFSDTESVVFQVVKITVTDIFGHSVVTGANDTTEYGIYLDNDNSSVE